MKLVELLASLQVRFTNLLRISIFLVMLWIGGLKTFQYEAEGIVPFVANSPVMSFFYGSPQEYSDHKNKEGEVVEDNISWHKKNNTYTFSYGLGAAIVSIGILVLLGIWLPKIGLLGGLLTFLMSLVTLSFLITTPETFVPDLGGPNHGFPYLSGSGRLVIKDLIMMTVGLVIASENAKKIVIQVRDKR